MKLEIKDNSAPTLEEYRLMVGSISKAVSTVLAHEAFLLSNEMKNGLIDQKPGGKQIRPLSRMTILLRGFRGGRGPTHTKALIDSASMVDAVQAKRKNKYHYTAGVHRNVRSKDGKKLINIAAIHEYGTRQYTVTVTPKMHRFSIALYMAGILKAPWRIGQKLKRKIPARPWLRPAHEVWEKDADTRFTLALGAILGVTP